MSHGTPKQTHHPQDKKNWSARNSGKERAPQGELPNYIARMQRRVLAERLDLSTRHPLQRYSNSYRNAARQSIRARQRL